MDWTAASSAYACQCDFPLCLGGTEFFADCLDAAVAKFKNRVTFLLFFFFRLQFQIVKLGSDTEA